MVSDGDVLVQARGHAVVRSSYLCATMLAMDASGDIATGTPAPALHVLPLEFSWTVRPTRRLMLLGQIPCLERFRSLPPTTRLWMRWVEPDRHEAEIEIASTSGDAPACEAQPLARGPVPDRWGGWALLRVAYAQGVVDVMLAGPEPSDGSPAPCLHLLACVDLSAHCDDVGLPPGAFPNRRQ